MESRIYQELWKIRRKKFNRIAKSYKEASQRESNMID